VKPAEETGGWVKRGGEKARSPRVHKRKKSWKKKGGTWKKKLLVYKIRRGNIRAEVPGGSRTEGSLKEELTLSKGGRTLGDREEMKILWRVDVENYGTNWREESWEEGRGGESWEEPKKKVEGRGT